MKNFFNRRRLTLIVGLALAGIFAATLSGCYLPSPLYGTWEDANGREKIVFMDDGTFSASISNSDSSITDYTGEWYNIDNVLIFHVKGQSNYSRNVEWSINGAILTLVWDSNKVLTLLHTAR